jgi:hypothetical protein
MPWSFPRIICKAEGKAERNIEVAKNFATKRCRAVLPPKLIVLGVSKVPVLTGLLRYSETGVHFVMDRNFVCLWRRHICN